jgi:hypothetical protein
MHAMIVYFSVVCSQTWGGVCMLSCGEDRAQQDLQSILGMFYFSQIIFFYLKVYAIGIQYSTRRMSHTAN